MAGTGVAIDDVSSEVYECRSLFACRGSASTVATTTNARRSSRIRDRSRSQRPGCLLSQGKGVFTGVVGSAEHKYFCKGVDCRFSHEYIGEKAVAVGYCLWCDGDKMEKAMENNGLRDRHVKRGLQSFYDNDEDVFRMALRRLPVQYRVYWPLKALGLPQRFYREANMKAALEDKNSSRYRIFIRELRALFLRDERLYNFVCERVPSGALEGIKTQISGPMRAKESGHRKLVIKGIKAREPC